MKIKLFWLFLFASVHSTVLCGAQQLVASSKPGIKVFLETSTPDAKAN